MNEIYRDLASIVDQQQESVDMIESNTEGAHARAQEGLAQARAATLFLPFGFPQRRYTVKAPRVLDQPSFYCIYLNILFVVRLRALQHLFTP